VGGFSKRKQDEEIHKKHKRTKNTKERKPFCVFCPFVFFVVNPVPLIGVFFASSHKERENDFE
jgi:hypothetical protein